MQEKYIVKNIVYTTFINLLIIRYVSGFMLGAWEIKVNKLQSQLSGGTCKGSEGWKALGMTRKVSMRRVFNLRTCQWAMGNPS